MSMNLCFDVKGGSGIVDFPFQTPTNLTFKVLKASTKEDRLLILKEQMLVWEWSKEDVENTLTEIEALFNNPNLELSYM